MFVNGIPELRACAGVEVRPDVARVEVGDGHEEAGPGERPQLPETEPAKGHEHLSNHKFPLHQCWLLTYLQCGPSEW